MAAVGAGGYGAVVKIMVSYGGEIRRGPGDGQAAYTWGENRLVKVGMSERLDELRHRLAALAGCFDVCIRYMLPGESLDALRDVVTDGDLWNLVTRLFYHEVAYKSRRIRVFLFRVDAPPTPSNALLAPGKRRRSASSSSLAGSEGDTAALTTRTSGGGTTYVSQDTGRDTAALLQAAQSASVGSAPTLGRRSASSPSLASPEKDTAVSTRRLRRQLAVLLLPFCLPGHAADCLVVVVGDVGQSEEDTDVSTTSSGGSCTSSAAQNTGPDSAPAFPVAQRTPVCPAPVFFVVRT